MHKLQAKNSKLIPKNSAMAEEKIDSYVDRTGFAQDTKFVLEELNRVFEAFKKLDEYKFRLNTPAGGAGMASTVRETGKEMEKAVESARKLSEAEKKLVDSLKASTQSFGDLAATSAANEIAMKKLAASKKEVEKAFKDGLISEEKYLITLGKIKEQQTAFSVSQQQVNLALRNLEKESQAAEGSLNELRAQLNLSQQAFDKLAQADREGETGQALLKNIGDLNQKVSELEQSTGRFQRSVGNYQGSAKIIVDALKDVEQEIENLKNRQNELQNLSKSNPIGFKLQGGDQALKDVNAQLARTTQQFQTLDKITTSPQFLNIAGKAGDVNKELRFFTQRLNELETAGLRNTKVYDDVRQRLAELTDQAADTKAEIKALASDTRSFDLFSGSVAFAADAFQTLAGAAALAGGSEEEVAKITQRLIAVQTVANGVKGIATQLTEKGTAANKVYAFVQGLVSLSMDKTAASAVRLKAALGLIAIAATVIGAVIIAMSQLDRKLSETRQRQQDLNDVLSESQSEYVAAVTNVNRLRTEIQAAKEGFISKEAVVKRYNETIGKTTGQVKTLDEAEKALSKNADAYIKFTLLKAAANLALGKAAEEAFKIQLNFNTLTLSDVGQARGQQIRTQATLAAQAAADAAKDAGKSAAEIEKAFNDAYNAAVTEALSPGETARQQSFTKIAEELNAQALALSKEFKFDFLGNLGETSKKADDNLQDLIASLRRTAFEAKKASDEAQIQFLQSQQDISPLINERLNLLNQEKELRIQIIRDTATFETQQSGLTAQEIERINEERDRKIAETRLKFIEKSVNDAKSAEADLAAYIDQQQQELLNKEAAALRKSLENAAKANQIRLAQYSIDRDNEITRLNQEFKKGLINKEKFEQEKLRIEAKYTRLSLLSQLDYLQSVLKQTDLTAEERKEVEAKIAAVQRKLSEQSTDDFTDNEKTKREQLKETLKYITDQRDQIIDAASGIFTSVYERQKNAIQEQIDLLDEQTAKEIEAANQSAASAEEKENRIAIIEARAAARRRTYELQQRRIEQERARFERAAQIVKIIGNTAAGITSALALVPPNVPLSIAIGAIGALQLAKVLATPIPKYRTGKGPGDNYEGLAIWGDGGKSELKVSPDGSMEVSPSSPALTYVRRKDIILPDAAAALESTKALTYAKTAGFTDGVVVENPQIDFSPLSHSINRMGNNIVKAIKTKKEIHFKGLTPGQRSIRHFKGNREYFDMNGIDF